MRWAIRTKSGRVMVGMAFFREGRNEAGILFQCSGLLLRTPYAHKKNGKLA